MLTIEECREILNEDTLSDEEVLVIRDALYSLSEQVIGRHYDTMDV